MRDWVLKRKPNAKNVGKLQSKWDGPYLVIKRNRLGSYHLADNEVKELEHSWNADRLKKYYVKSNIVSKYGLQIYKELHTFHIFLSSFFSLQEPYSFPHKRGLHIEGEVFNEAGPM